MHHGSDLPHDEGPLFLQEFGLVDYLQHIVLFDRLLLLHLSLLLDEVNLSILGSAQ